MKLALTYLYCWLHSRHSLSAQIARNGHAYRALQAEKHRQFTDSAMRIAQLEACQMAMAMQRDDLFDEIDELRIDNQKLLEKWWEKS